MKRFLIADLGVQLLGLTIITQTIAEYQDTPCGIYYGSIYDTPQPRPGGGDDGIVIPPPPC